jgi:hypothetical protein
MEEGVKMYTFLTLACIISTGAITLYMLENFGELQIDKKVGIEAQNKSDKLIGEFANAVTAMSIVVVILAGLYVLSFLYGRYKRLGEPFWSLIVLSMVIGIVSCGFNLHLTEKFVKLHDDNKVKLEPINPPNDSKLKGSFADTVLVLSAVSVGLSSVALVRLGYLWTKESDWVLESSSNRLGKEKVTTRNKKSSLNFEL